MDSGADQYYSGRPQESSSSSSSCGRFFAALSSAVSEWSLIIILLINAVLAYLTTRIARLCKLPAPCLLCSRLDHVLGDETKGFYRNLFCHAHKIDISALVYCHAHRKLADLHEMCEACLLSSAAAAIRKPKPLGAAANLEDAHPHSHGEKLVDHNAAPPPLLNENDPAKQDSLGTNLCSCCSEPFTLRRLLQVKKKKVGSAGGGSVSNRRAQLRKRILDKSLDPRTAPDNHDLLSHVGYSELHIRSDSESEVPFPDAEDDSGYAPVRSTTKDIKEESVLRSRRPPSNEGLATTILEDTVPERLIHPNPVVVPEHSKPNLNDGNSCDKSSTTSKADMNWIGNADAKSSKPVESTRSAPEQVCREITAETIVTDRNPATAASTSLEPGKVQSSSASITSHDPGLAARLNLADRSESFKNALAKKGIMLSPRFSELVAGKGQEDLKVWLSQKSYRALDLAWSDVTSSPRLQAQGVGGDESSTSVGLQNIAKRLTVERNNSSLENFDANLLSDIERETSVDRLKQQIELDRKSMSALYKELEEERSASAVAANEAMAMINRLQEEKAAMQMEALQYLRVMEEQYEYDQEAIQKLNDLLTEREKELMDLDAEIESYRKKLGEAPMESRLYLESATSTPRRVRLVGRCKSEEPKTTPQESTEHGGAKDPLPGFEEEKAQISACLKKLQKKLQVADEAAVASSSTNAMENGLKCRDTINGVEISPETTSSSPLLLQDEVAKLKGRLNALEADKEFVVHAMIALKYGSDGVRLVQEIACQLKELRRIPVA